MKIGGFRYVRTLKLWKCRFSFLEPGWTKFLIFSNADWDCKLGNFLGRGGIDVKSGLNYLSHVLLVETLVDAHIPTNWETGRSKKKKARKWTIVIFNHDEIFESSLLFVEDVEEWKVFPVVERVEHKAVIFQRVHYLLFTCQVKSGQGQIKRKDETST